MDRRLPPEVICRWVGHRRESYVGGYYFKPGMKVTVIVRAPGFPDRDFMMTNDDISELQALLKRRVKQEPTT